MDDLIRYGRVRASQLGVAVRDVNEQDAGALGLKTIAGVVVNYVNEGSPAERAGIQPGDVVVQIDGQRVDRVSTLQRIVRSHEPGETVRVDVVRFGGERRTVSVRVAEREGTSVEPARAAARPIRDGTPTSSKLGISVQTYTGVDAPRGAVPGVAGARVMQVSPSGPAAALLREEFDVVVEVLAPGPRRAIKTPEDLAAAINRLKAGDYISLYVRSLDPQSVPFRVVNIRIGE
jgi:S1-C subfamily serine protease